MYMHKKARAHDAGGGGVVVCLLTVCDLFPHGRIIRGVGVDCARGEAAARREDERVARGEAGEREDEED